MGLSAGHHAPAAELKLLFDVYGHFYSVELDGGVTVECRSVLELAARGRAVQDSARLATQRPDAIFIMMNPGSSRPLSGVIERIPSQNVGGLQTVLVPTRPDTTQYQVMRLMQQRGWQHVRVLNLSDLRCARSPDFFRQFTHLETRHGYEAHSLFSTERTLEFRERIGRFRNLPLVLAWGLSPKLDPLIRRCLAMLPTRCPLLGLQAAGLDNKYRHPLPSLHKDQRVWVELMTRQLDSVLGPV